MVKLGFNENPFIDACLNRKKISFFTIHLIDFCQTMMQKTILENATKRKFSTRNLKHFFHPKCIHW